ncbi:MAG TPA: InlB B-repeat-containing protein [Treponemataceae bacterium]|nr:InlB B-repeat-containing protein [Treponemataceae bacterium]
MRKVALSVALFFVVALSACKQASSADPVVPPTPVAHTVTFVASGGEGTMTPQSIVEGQSAALTPNAFTKQGNFFAGWSTGVAGSATIADGATYTMGTADVTLSATWSAVPAYAITFDPSGGTGTMAAQSIVSGQSANLAPNAFAKAGYAFAGWATSSGGTAIYADCASYPMGSAPVTLWATWVIKPTHALRFDAAGGTGSMDDIKIIEDLSATIPANTLTKSGCRFVGWATTACGPVAYASGASYVMGTADATLYAVWEDRWTVIVPANSYITDIDKDQHGNTFVVGEITESLDDVNIKGMNDVFVRKYDASGRKLWTVTLGVSGKITEGSAITVDASGNSYICGTSAGSIGDQTCTGTNDMMIAKVSPLGTLVWIRLLGSANVSTTAHGIDCDAQGNCYVTGITNGALGGEQNLTSDQSVAFISRYDTNGNRTWTKLFEGRSCGNGVAVDTNGKVFVTGGVFESVGGQALTGTGDLFICEYDQLGTRSWISLAGAGGKETCSKDIALDGSGSLIICGYTYGDLDTQTHTGISDMFVGKYAITGHGMWTRLLGVIEKQTRAEDICVDGVGGIYVTGYTSGNLDGQEQSGLLSVFVVNYLSTGEKQWTMLKNSTGGSEGEGICYDDAAGAIIVAGAATSSFDGQSFTGRRGFLSTRFTP